MRWEDILEWRLRTYLEGDGRGQIQGTIPVSARRDWEKLGKASVRRAGNQSEIPVGSSRIKSLQKGKYINSINKLLLLLLLLFLLLMYRRSVRCM